MIIKYCYHIILNPNFLLFFFVTVRSLKTSVTRASVVRTFLLELAIRASLSGQAESTPGQGYSRVEPDLNRIAILLA